MSEPKPEIEAVSIVLAGSFNPRIFHPAWFAKENLIQESEGQTAEIQVITSDVAVFSIGWMGLEVVHDRFAITSNQPQYFDALRDLVSGMFKLLRHSPISQLGINKLEHYRSLNEDEWHQLGHRLAPKEPWTGLLEKPGMRRLSMLGVRPDQFAGKLLVTVEPSVKIRPGVYFEVNDHYQNDVADEGRSCDRMVEILNVSWQQSLERAANITRTLMTRK